MKNKDIIMMLNFHANKTKIFTKITPINTNCFTRGYVVSDLMETCFIEGFHKFQEIVTLIFIQ